jgi:hypothetical protein
VIRLVLVLNAAITARKLSLLCNTVLEQDCVSSCTICNTGCEPQSHQPFAADRRTSTQTNWWIDGMCKLHCSMHKLEAGALAEWLAEWLQTYFAEIDKLLLTIAPDEVPFQSSCSNATLARILSKYSTERVCCCYNRELLATSQLTNSNVTVRARVCVRAIWLQSLVVQCSLCDASS